MDEPYYDLPHNEIYKLELPTDESVKDEKTPPPASVLVAKLAYSASGVAFSADGKRIAFHAEENLPKPRSHQQTDLFVMDIDATQAGSGVPPVRNFDCELRLRDG
ncbi:hypothetical protein [Tunturiibacter lichenicola]|uniref:hypothetical protein n=1 Tax=Tunturiibacter lichenicola TaxID=2051959 RepID=UPI003D9BBD62